MKILDVPQSGSVAGITSSRNRFGQYRRTRATPVNPATTDQTVARTRLSTQAAAWRNLTAAQRDAWAALGLQMQRTDSLGQTYDLTGFMAYVSINSNNSVAGDAIVSDPPLFLTPAALTGLILTGVGSTSLSAAFAPSPLAAGQRIFYYLSNHVSVGVNFQQNFKLILVSSAAATTPTDLYAAYIARWGDFLTGEKITVSATVYDSGFVSPAFLISTIAT